jgi:tRNA (cmo5U34)-methyltransferase
VKDDIYSPKGVKGTNGAKEGSLKGSFAFDKNVVDVFPDMIKRSVPGYQDIADLQSQLLALHLKPQDLVYDLGISLGNSIYNLKRYFNESIDIIGVDNSKAMLQKLDSKLQQETVPYNVELVESAIQDVKFKASKAIILNFTLQFIPREDRKELLKKCYDSLVPGGVLLISEKIKSDHKVLEELQVEVHHNFKRNNGYSDLEIHKKREAIDDYLRPDTVATHLKRFDEVGFTASEILYKWFNFTSFVCIKEGE